MPDCRCSSISDLFWRGFALAFATAAGVGVAIAIPVTILIKVFHVPGAVVADALAYAIASLFR